MMTDHAQIVGSVQPSPHLYLRIRSGFVGIGQTLHRWCGSKGYSQANVQRALTGKWKGPRASAICREVAEHLSKSGVAL